MSAKSLFFLTLLAVMAQAFFAMMEMALVSFNKVRLQYYLSKENKKAKLISILLMHPGILFGTTLIGINTALQLGSELSRRFYASIGLNPDFAPLTQVFIVVIFAELAPLIAARRYAEHVALLGVRILYWISWVLRPFVLLLDGVIKIVLKIFHFSKPGVSALTKEELQKAIESREDKKGFLKEEEFDQVMENLFSLKNKTAQDLMVPLSQFFRVSASQTLNQLKEEIKDPPPSFLIVDEENRAGPIGFFSLRESVFSPKDELIKNLTRLPLFVDKDLNLYQLIEQFKKSDLKLAFVVDHQGKTLGVMTLSRILEAVFEIQRLHLSAESKSTDHTVYINRSFLGDTPVKVINETYHIQIPFRQEEETLSELMQETLGHHPSFGESVRAGEFELTVEESPLIGEKIILVKTL